MGAHWSNYRWRFVPWLSLSLTRTKSASFRRVTSSEDQVVTAEKLCLHTMALCRALHEALPRETHVSEQCASNDHFRFLNRSIYDELGFELERKRSAIQGTGVFVSRGRIAKNSFVCFYPGTVYQPGEPVLLVSIKNAFIFRRSDGILIDGKDRGLSRSVFKSCTYRDRMGPYLCNDLSWLSSRPLNPLAIGQYVNNATPKILPNVCYQELTLDLKDWKPKHLQFLPYIEDNADLLEQKCLKLANLLRHSRCTLVYTGAGCSTAASIPDYRGPNGVWTLAEKGIEYSRCCDPVQTEPTTTHMGLRELYKRGYVRHILSQNCDGLHLRSGLPQKSLSEVHGNMYIEVCSKCKPLRQYIRSFDVTGQTRFRRHKTGRQCEQCYAPLLDTIVHFGEHGKNEWPLNWKATSQILEENACELILCLGSSLKILKKYTFLWPSSAERKQTKLVIINLQWTPKDKVADLKINGKCDEVMGRVMQLLNLTVPPYCRSCDPVLSRKRRNVRNSELMDRISECSCIAANINCEPCQPTNSKVPGWWTAGFSAKRPGAGRGRPCKRRRSLDPDLEKETSSAAQPDLATDSGSKPADRGLRDPGDHVEEEGTSSAAHDEILIGASPERDSKPEDLCIAEENNSPSDTASESIETEELTANFETDSARGDTNVSKSHFPLETPSEEVDHETDLTPPNESPSQFSVASNAVSEDSKDDLEWVSFSMSVSPSISPIPALQTAL